VGRAQQQGQQQQGQQGLMRKSQALKAGTAAVLCGHHLCRKAQLLPA
jgi:hypothetical protein